jgi:uncharacterized membrane protein
MTSAATEKRVLLTLVLVSVAIGVYARAAHLDRKLFFQDESVTAVRVSGHRFDAIYGLYDGKVRPVADVARLMERDPSAGIGSIARIMAHEDPHHAPLFYALDRIGIDLAGSSTASAFRFPSVVFGILAIGFAFLFGRTLYRSNAGGAITAALVALSPLHVIYSRQAREYSLFTCVVFAANFCLLGLLDRRSIVRAVAYAVTVSLGIYTDPIFGLVIAAHAVCAVVIARRDLRTLGTYALATAAGIASCLPWALHAFRVSGRISQELDWGNTAYPPKFLAEKWAFNIGALFFDAEFADFRLAAIAAVVVAIVLVAFVLFVRGGEPRARALALPLTLIPFATFVAFDLARGSHFATIPRYMTAGWIGLEIVVASVLVAGIANRSRVAQSAFVFLVAAGSFSAFVDNRAENWWDNNSQVAYQAVARAIDATAAQPPLIVEGNLYEVSLMLSRYVRPDATMLLYRGSSIPALPAATRIAYLVVPSSESLAYYTSPAGGGFAAKNISPATRTVITSFHQQLAHDATFKGASDPDPAHPDNALWLLTRR